MYTEYDISYRGHSDRNGCRIQAMYGDGFADDVEVAALNTTLHGCEDEDFQALSQLLQDEFGDQYALYNGGELFEIVAVPDDVAGEMPPPGCFCVEYDKNIPADFKVMLDSFVDSVADDVTESAPSDTRLVRVMGDTAYEEPRRVTGRALPDVRR